MDRLLRLALLGLCVDAGLWAQAQTYVIRVNPNGSFSPQVTYIKSGDTVRWEQLTRADSVIPVSTTATYPAMCTQRSGYVATDRNDLTGPLPFAPSGIFTLGPLAEGLGEVTGASCGAGSQIVARGDNGKILCAGKGALNASLEATWRSANNTGVFIRLLWSDINPKAGVYDFTALQREMEQAVKQGKLFSLGIKAGNDGTPDWIFSTNADNSSRVGGGGGVTRLHLQDAGSDTVDLSCGKAMDLGNPTKATYQQLYFAMLTETVKFIKTRADPSVPT